MPRIRSALALIAATSIAVATCGCVYRPTIQQGNLLQLDEIDQVKVGMTRSQVRYILGTPMVSDPFEPDRWDYVYTLQMGHNKRIDRAHFVVLFDGDKVSQVDKLDLPEETDVAQRVRAERDKRAAAEAAAAQTPGSAPVAPVSPATAEPPATAPGTTTPEVPAPPAPETVPQPSATPPGG